MEILRATEPYKFYSLFSEFSIPNFVSLLMCGKGGGCSKEGLIRLSLLPSVSPYVCLTQ